MLATDVSFEYERARKNNGTSTALTAETHRSMRTRLGALTPRVMTLDSLTVTIPQARDFVESLAPCTETELINVLLTQ